MSSRRLLVALALTGGCGSDALETAIEGNARTCARYRDTVGSCCEDPPATGEDRQLCLDHATWPSDWLDCYLPIARRDRFLSCELIDLDDGHSAAGVFVDYCYLSGDPMLLGQVVAASTSDASDPPPAPGAACIETPQGCASPTGVCHDPIRF